MRPVSEIVPPPVVVPVPDGYPLAEWADPPGQWAVPVELRAHYAAIAATGTGSHDQYLAAPIPNREVVKVSDTGSTVEYVRLTHTEWAHNVRMAGARMRAEQDKYKTAKAVCESCGIEASSLRFRVVTVRDQRAAVCAPCFPEVEAAARRLDLLPDGRTRAAAQAALIERLLEVAGGADDPDVDAAHAGAVS